MREAKTFLWTLLFTRLKFAMTTLRGDISLCNDLKTVCIDGGYCSESEGDDYSCQCRGSSPNCEVQVSDLCYKRALSYEKQKSQKQFVGFCINDGRCATSDDGRFYCICKESIFTGPHCELFMDRFLQLVGIPTASPTTLNATTEAPSLVPTVANQSDVPNSQISLAPSPSPSNETSLTPSIAPSIANNSSSVPTLSASPSRSFAPSTAWPSLSVYPTATWMPTVSAIPTITTLPTATSIPTTSEPSNVPSASPSAAPSIVVTTTSPTERPVQERRPVPDNPPPFVVPTPSRTHVPNSENGGLNNGASVGIGLVAAAVVAFSAIFYFRRRRRYSQPGRMTDGDLELTTNYLDDQDGWANQRPLTAGTRHHDALI